VKVSEDEDDDEWKCEIDDNCCDDAGSDADSDVGADGSGDVIVVWECCC